MNNLLAWLLIIALSARLTTAVKDDEVDTGDLEQTLDTLSKNVEEEEIDVSAELEALLDRIKNTVGTSFSAISEQNVIKSWREGLAIERDLDFDRTITYYKLKSIYDFPCRSIDFLFNIKGDFSIYEFNVKRFLLCFLRYNDLEIKEYLSDIVVEGGINILKSGYNNPVSTFFSNVLIIEGPLKLKEELFGALYKYVDTQPEQNGVFKELISNLIKLTFDKEKHEKELSSFVKVKSTTLLFFFYDIIITFLKDNDVYLSAYDFIQPDSTMVTNKDSMDPKNISQNFKDALEKDLAKFKELRESYVASPTSTIYHKAYSKYIADNVSILCRFLYSTEDC